MHCRRFKLFSVCSLTLVLTFFFEWATASPTTSPAVATTHPSTNPLTRMARQAAERQKRKQLLNLTRRSIDLLQDKRYAEAEKTLNEALQLDPHEPTNLYNMACLKSLTHHPDEAFDYLDRAALAGFTDFIHISQDSDLDILHSDPRYKAFLAEENEYQLKAAEEAVKNLKQQFGSDYLYEIDQADKLIFATNTDQQTLDDLKHDLLRQAHAQWHMLFEHHPDQYVEVVVPSPRDYRRLVVNMPGVEGYYDPIDRTLIASGLGFVTTHEFTHALHAADLEPSGQEHPIWLVEGLATMFENTAWEKGPDGVEILAPRDSMRLRDLQRSARMKELIPLARIFKMDQKDFVGEAMLCYAESGSVMHYLYDRGLLRKFYDTFKDTYNQDKTARLALEKVTGQSLDDFQKDWEAWMLKRIPPTLRAASDGPYMGVRFGYANDGVLIQMLVSTGPARKAGLRVGDVLVAVDDRETRDETTFLEALNTHKPGETLTFKLRRNGTYMQLSMVLGSKSDPHVGGATQPVSRSREMTQ